MKVHSVLTIVSSTPVEKGRVWPLSPLDHAMGQHSLHVIFYYRSGSFDMDRIRAPLNEVLSLYPIVTGRLARDGDGDGDWQVKCTDAGVRFYIAKASIRVDEWLRFAGAHDEKLLSSWEDVPDDPHIWSPFRIQLTEFEGGGAAVALSCPHMLADPTSATLLIKSWTDAVHREPISHPPFLHPLALSPPPTTTTTAASPSYYASKSTNSIPQKPPKMASATFCFSDSTITNSLSEVRSTLPNATPFDLLAALFWTRISRLKGVAQESTCSMSICMDMRKRLQAPLPYGYFGNALHFSQLRATAHELECGDLSHVVGLVQQHVAGLNLEDEFWSSVDWFRSMKDEQQGKLAPPFRMYGPELTCVNMDHMIAPVANLESQPLMYMTGFEKGQKPVHVSYQVGNSEGEGLILVMPSPEGGLATRVAVMLPEEEMEGLMEDKAILSLEPTLLLSGRN